METQLPIDTGDTASIMYGRTREEAEGETLYPDVLPQASVPVGGLDQQGYLTSIPMMPIRPTIPRGIPPLATSAVAISEYPRKIPLSRTFMISRDAQDFISKQKKSIQFRGDLLKISDRISEFLEKQGIRARVSIDLFADPEYRDWTETVIKIGTSEEKLAKVYAICDELFRYSLEGIRKRSLKKLTVAIEKTQ